MGEPARFTELMRRAKRNKDASRTALSILKADSKVGQALERALAEAGLTLPQFNILMELASSPDGEMPLHELTRRLIATPPNISWLSDRMRVAGLVTKERDAGDRRVVVMTITERGWEKVEEAAPLVFGAEKKLLTGFSRDELRTLVRLLGKVLEA